MCCAEVNEIISDVNKDFRFIEVCFSNPLVKYVLFLRALLEHRLLLFCPDEKRNQIKSSACKY